MRKTLMVSTSAVALAAAIDTGSKGSDLSKADKAMVKGIRKAYEDDRGHDMRLTDSAVLAIVNACEGWDDMDGEEQLKLFDKAEDAFKGIAVSDPGITGLVNAMDEQALAELDECVEAIIKGKQSALDMLGQFKRVWSKQQFDACPFPGTDENDVKGTNYAPDIKETPAVAGGKIRTVFTNDLVQAMPKGKAAQLDMDDADKELTVSNSIARYKNKGKQELRDIINSAKQVRDGMRKVVRAAIQIHHRLSELDGMPLVQWNWITGSNDKCPLIPTEYRGKKMVKVTRGPKPIWLVPVVDGVPDHAKGKEYSVAQIIAFNPTKALAMPEGGTVGNLVDSAKGEPETPETIGEKMPDETMDTTVVVINAKIANTQARAALRTRMLQPDNETARAAYCALYINLRGFYQANEKWYEAHLEAQEALDTRSKDTNDKTVRVA